MRAPLLSPLGGGGGFRAADFGYIVKLKIHNQKELKSRLYHFS